MMVSLDDCKKAERERGKVDLRFVWIDRDLLAAAIGDGGEKIISAVLKNQRKIK